MAASSSRSHQLELSCHPEFELVSQATDNTLQCVLSLHAPATAAESADERKPIDIVFVMDRSGSMSNRATPQLSKMQLVNDTVAFASTLLKQSDRAALVTFDSEMEVVCELTNLDTTGKDTFTTRSSRVTPRGGTNISDGLMLGLEVLSRRGRKSNPSFFSHAFCPTHLTLLCRVRSLCCRAAHGRPGR